MKSRTLLALLVVAFAIPLSGCPKKNSDEPGVEQSEGSSTADKSGEGASDEMQEKKPTSADASPDTGNTETNK
jgi:hypothetical protein